MDKEEAYDSKINPLMARIIAICKEHKIPMVASFGLDYEEGGLSESSATTGEVFGIAAGLSFQMANGL